MKRFHWPLQRLLDVTCQREKSQQAELLALTRRIARLRQEALVHRASVRGMILEMSRLDCQQRVRRHEDFLICSEARRTRARRMEAKAVELAAQRAEKTQKLLKARKSRETLERLRAEARDEHLREQRKGEQKQFDETAHVASARKLIEAHLDAE